MQVDNQVYATSARPTEPGAGVTGGKWLLLSRGAPFQPASWEMGEDEDGQSRQPDLGQHISRSSLSDLVST